MSSSRKGRLVPSAFCPAAEPAVVSRRRAARNEPETARRIMALSLPAFGSLWLRRLRVLLDPVDRRLHHEAAVRALRGAVALVRELDQLHVRAAALQHREDVLVRHLADAAELLAPRDQERRSTD